MAILPIYNAVASCSVLIEYRGAASAVVILVPFGGAGQLLRDIHLGVARHQALQGWASEGLNGLITAGIQLLPAIAGQTDVNGFLHRVVGIAALLSAGDAIRVEAYDFA